MKIGIRYPYHLEQRILLYLMPTVKQSGVLCMPKLYGDDEFRVDHA